MRRRALASASVAALAAAALLAAGCGYEGTVQATPETVEGPLPTQPTETTPAGDPAAGKAIFTSAAAGCFTCHTLADANATGTIGPNLDEKKPPLDLVLDRVTNGKPGTAMTPFKDRLTPQQIADVAAYVVQATSGG